MSDNVLKSPLRYPGGKTRAIKTLDPWVTDFAEWREPFLGGGSMSIHMSKKYPDKPIWVNDLYVPLYNFWTVLQKDGDNLSDAILAIKKTLNDATAKDKFNECLAEMKNQNSFDAAVSFYILNKCSYSGLTENSTFSITASQQNFSEMNIGKLKGYSKIIKNWKITNIDYSKVMLATGKDVFVFLDPPYDIKDFLYGTGKKMHSSFVHADFADNVDKCTHNFMITYNVNDYLVDRYKSYFLKKWKLQYGMVHRKESNLKEELLITNYDVDAKRTTRTLWD